MKIAYLVENILNFRPSIGYLKNGQGKRFRSIRKRSNRYKNTL